MPASLSTISPVNPATDIFLGANPSPLGSSVSEGISFVGSVPLVLVFKVALLVSGLVGTHSLVFT